LYAQTAGHPECHDAFQSALAHTIRITFLVLLP